MAKSKIKLENHEDGHKEILFDFMLKNLIDKLIVYFDGGGDDGGINDIEAVGPMVKNWSKISNYKVEGAKIKQHCGWTNGEESFTWKENVSLLDIVYDICYRVLNKSFGGWENDDGSCGEFVIDAKTRKIILTMKQRYYEYEVSEHEL
jgi:hypothetical protein